MSAIRDSRLNHTARVLLDTLLPSKADPALQYGVLDTDFAVFWSDLELYNESNLQNCRKVS